VRSLMREVPSPNPAERVRASPPLSPDERMDVGTYQAMRLDAALELLVPFGDDAARLRRSLGSREHWCGLSPGYTKS
jgi:hypothetical protein